jgi:hypothetical protein
LRLVNEAFFSSTLLSVAIMAGQAIIRGTISNLASACMIVLLAIGVLYAPSLRPQAKEDAALMISIAQATLTEHESSADLSGMAGKSRQVTLPVLERRSPRKLASFDLRAEFKIPDIQAASLWAIYFVSLYDGGRVLINGVPIADVQTSTQTISVRNVRPYYFPIPAELLRNGSNQIEVKWSVRESTIISRMLIGPADVVSDNYQRRLFWQNTMAQVTFVYALIIALIMLGIYGLRRHQISYRQLGMSAIGTAIVVFVYILPPLPAPLFPYWRLLHIVGISMYSQGAWLFIISEVQPENRWYPKACAAVGLLGPSVYLINFWLQDVSFMPDFERVWGMFTPCTY